MSIAINGQLPQGFAVDGQAVNGLASSGQVIWSSEPQYVTDGLLLRLDSLENLRSGYSGNTNVWEDLSGNGNDFNLHSFSHSADGWKPDGLYFPNDAANRYGQCVNILPLPNNSPFTVAVLVRLENVPARISQQFLANWTSSSPSGGISFGLSDNVYNVLKFHTKSSIELNSSKNVNASVHTFSVTHTYPGIDKMFIDEAFDSSKESSESPTANKNMYMARYSGGQYLKGAYIKSVLLYNRALSDDEIAQNSIVNKKRFNI